MSAVDPSFEFAARYGDPYGTTLTAAHALSRLDDLSYELEQLSSVNDILDYKEIVSYYVVAAVTALEWHARARLHDMLVFNPALIIKEDLEAAKITPKKVADSIAANVSVAQMITSAQKINRMESYSKIFSRLFAAIGSSMNVDDIVRDICGFDQKNPRETRRIDLYQMFSFRHTLVHEINEEIVGAKTFRSHIPLSSAKEYIDSSNRLISEIEREIRSVAPDSFPNLIDDDKAIVSPELHMVSEIQRIEERIDALYSQPDISDRHKDDRTITAMAMRLSRQYIESELAFVEGAHIFYSRYSDYRYVLRNILLEGRLRYLKRLLIEIENLSPEGNGQGRLYSVER